jgi:ADP-ribosylglycohydrolase
MMKLPLANSYWVVPGQLLAGEHPSFGDEQVTQERITALLASGVRNFIDLTEPGEVEPYSDLLPAGINYFSFPMPDHGIPKSLDLMRDVQMLLAQLFVKGQGAYVHCRAGIGRTGMAIGCYLCEQSHEGSRALIELNQLWKQNARSERWLTIPETQEQETFVRLWQPRQRLADTLQVRPQQRYRGALVALALGDAVGAAMDVGREQSRWTGDTAMAICVVESLLACDGFDGRDQLERYREWVGGADPTVRAKLSRTVTDTLSRSLWSRSALVGSHDPNQLDPAPLARCAAPALFSGGDISVASSLGADVARVTHQAPVLVDTCRLFTCMIATALAGKSKDEILIVSSQMDAIPLKQEVVQVAQGWLLARAGRRRAPTAILGCLDRAVRAFNRSDSFAAGFERVAAHGKDLDATCAAYGALAGAFYGADSISEPMLARVTERARLELLADRLLARVRVSQMVGYS